MPNICGDIEEERRITFMGISRAMRLLYLSHTTTRMGRTAKRSLFLDEILVKNNKTLLQTYRYPGTGKYSCDRAIDYIFLICILMTHKKSLYELLLKFFFYCAD